MLMLAVVGSMIRLTVRPVSTLPRWMRSSRMRRIVRAKIVFGGHEQGVGAVQGERDVSGCGGVEELFGLAADDAAVLVVFGQDRGVAGAQPQAAAWSHAARNRTGSGSWQTPQWVRSFRALQ
jgi:hypothetical protein